MPVKFMPNSKVLSKPHQIVKIRLDFNFDINLLRALQSVWNYTVQLSSTIGPLFSSRIEHCVFFQGIPEFAEKIISSKIITHICRQYLRKIVL